MGLRRISRKRGSLNLSINAIVVLILAITMLGLGLGFINKLFGGATDSIGDQITAINDQDQKRLEQDGITQLSKGNVEMKKKETKQLVLAVKNDDGNDRQYALRADCYYEDGAVCAASDVSLRSAIGYDYADASKDSAKTVPGEQLRTYAVVVETKPGIIAGVYTFELFVGYTDGACTPDTISGLCETKTLPLVVTVR